MQHTIIRLLLICMMIGLFGSPATPANASTHSDTLLSGQYESQYGGTTIWLKMCGQGASYRFRSESLPNYTQMWDGTYGAINGCLGFSYRAIVGSQPGSQFLIYSMVMDSPLSTTDFLQRARADICTVNAPGVISCSRQLRTLPDSYIDQPTGGQVVQGNITVSGWAIDKAATSGTGVSDIHIYANAGTDIFYGPASYGQARSDVAGAYGDTRFTNSGFNLTIDTGGLPNGSVTIKVAMKSTESGQWNWKTQQITVNNPIAPPSTPTPPPILHTDTQLSALSENGKTTILMKICGNGPVVRLSSELKGSGDTSQFLGDWTRGAVANNCSPGYRPVIGASVGAQVRFYSTVLNQNIAVADFRTQARKDVCKVVGLGQITCTTGSAWQPEVPPIEPINPAAQLNLIFPLPLPVQTTRHRNPVYHDGYSVDFVRDGAIANTVPIVATHDGYLSGYRMKDGTWCAWVSTEPNKDDPKSYTSAYCHVTADSIPKDKIGKWVRRGDQIALMGLTGNTTGLHVHYDLSHNGKKIPPVPMCGILVFITNTTYSTCKTTPTQAQASITPNTASSLSVLLNPGASIASTDQALNSGAASADFTFQFPAGATQVPLSAEFTELFAPTQEMSGQIAALHYFRLDAYDSQFNPTAQLNQPYTAVINYIDTEIAALGINEASLNLHFYNGSGWEPCTGCTVDTVNNRLTVTLNHFGEFALVGTIEYNVFLPNVNR